MRIIVPAISALLSLAGCHEKPSVTSETRFNRDGVDMLHSKVTLADGIARFQCLRSHSGNCHYLVVPGNCHVAAVGAQTAGEPAPDGCAGESMDQFSLAAGSEKQLPGLSRDFRHCVDAAAMPLAPQCLTQ